jgi:Ca2+-binding RTX toxin-like protein
MSLRYPSAVVFLEELERRSLLTIAYPSAQDQLIVELINRGRADPMAEAARYGIALNEGVPLADTIYATAKQPVAINLNLTSAAQEHSFWMIDNDTFSHTGAGGSQPKDRMAAAGYAFTGSWAAGENIAYRGSTGPINVNALAAQLHADLFIDTNYPNRGHRTNQMNPAWREVGVGTFQGVFTASGTNFNALIGTEDFAKSGTNVFLTGVAYTDAVVNDDFYTIGEAAAGVVITATRNSDNATFTTTTWSSGGYSLALPAGTYTVTATNGQLGGTVVHSGVVIGTENVKRDFRPDMVAASFASLGGDGKLTVSGSSDVDVISITQSGNTITTTRNGVSQFFSTAAVTSIEVYLNAGNDSLGVGPGVMRLYCDGGEGNDYLQGGDGFDTLTGNAGHDIIKGGNGDDRINGSGGHDKLYGENGNDRIYGGAGYDLIDGGAHIDRMWGEAGQDTLYGQGGNDQFYTLDGELDTLYGGPNTDLAQRDDADLTASIETRMV